MNIFDKTGAMAIGTRLRLLSERLTKESEKIFELYDVQIKPKWYPVIYALLECEDTTTVTQIANEIGQSHVSVVKIVKEMSKEGFLIEQKDTLDKRKTNIKLSQEGKQKVAGLKYQHQDVTIAIEEMLNNTNHNLWLAIDEFEKLLDEKSTYPRVLEEKRQRESSHIKILEYKDEYYEEFKTLNEKWINEYFKLEEKDIKTLENPKETILDKGGKILIALYDGKVVGTSALIKASKDENTYDYELAKMSVDSNYRGKGIGLLLGEAIIQKAKDLNAKTIFLDSNTVLTPAINLYKKLGFKKVSGYSNPYERSNIQMKLEL